MRAGSDDRKPKPPCFLTKAPLRPLARATIFVYDSNTIPPAFPGRFERSFSPMILKNDCESIYFRAVAGVQPGEAVRRALMGRSLSPGKTVLVSVGKAACPMAEAARSVIGPGLTGVVITKYGHTAGALNGLAVIEAGHPVPDENSFRAAGAALTLTKNLSADDTVLLLLSGGGSALFESPLVSPSELMDVTNSLLRSGADIRAVNTVRKRLSAVKAGRFALHCAPAKVLSVVLSDVIGDPLDVIASGPAAPDPSTCAEAAVIVERYQIKLSGEAWKCLLEETPKFLPNAESIVVSGVKRLCAAAATAAAGLGYAPAILTDCLCCEAREAGRYLAKAAMEHRDTTRPLALIAGGETVVTVLGRGKGGRCQEMALAAAIDMAGIENAALFAAGSDGTDGPTDAAGAFVDGSTAAALSMKGLDPHTALLENNSYPVLSAVNALFKPGPTGTNVNDLALLLIRP